MTTREPPDPPCDHATFLQEDEESNRNDVEDLAQEGRAQPNTLGKQFEEQLRHRFADCGVSTTEEVVNEILELCYSAGREDQSVVLKKLKSLADIADQPLVLDDVLITAIERAHLDVIRELLKKERRNVYLLRMDIAARGVVRLRMPRVLKELLLDNPRIDSTLRNELLLLACQELGTTDGRMDDRMECFKLMADQPNINVECEDDEGNTPLHYAASANSTEAVIHLLKLGSFLGHRNVHGVSPLAHMSCDALSDLFDKCIDKISWEPCEYGIKFDYHFLIPHITRSQQSDEKKSRFSEMEVLACIAENRRQQSLLLHPLLSSFLYLKWHGMRPICYAHAILYVMFYILINIYVLSTNPTINFVSSSPPISSNLTSNLHTNYQLNALRFSTVIFLIPLAVGKICQLISSPVYYFTNLQNIRELHLIVLGVWTLVAPGPVIGVVVMLLSGLELVILIGHWGLFTRIEMLSNVTEVNRIYVRYLFLYGFLFLAFALALCMLFSNTKGNENCHDPVHSLFKTVTMLTGEFHAIDIPFVLHPLLSRYIFLLFVFFIAVVMLNPLIGLLAVSDTVNILNKSEIVALVSRVKWLSYIEGVAIDPRLIKFAGRCFSERTVRRYMFKPYGFPAMKTLIFPGNEPHKQISVLPHRFNEVIFGNSICPRLRSDTRCKPDWSMDALIISRAKDILLRREQALDGTNIRGKVYKIKRIGDFTPAIYVNSNKLKMSHHLREYWNFMKVPGYVERSDNYKRLSELKQKECNQKEWIEKELGKIELTYIKWNEKESNQKECNHKECNQKECNQKECNQKKRNQKEAFFW